MSDIIRIQPTPALRVAFARWAVAQTPKVRTVGLHVFGVPADLFAGMPEGILVGAMVDGRRYVSPDEDAAEGRPAPGAELLGVAAPDPATVAAFNAQQPGEQEAVPDEALPEAPASAHGPDSALLATVGDEGPETVVPLVTGGEPPEETAPFACDLCPRDYPTQRGRDTHRRQKHPEA